MSEDTIEHAMPRQLPDTHTGKPPTGEQSYKLKIYEEDQKVASDIQSQGQEVFRLLTIQEVLREAVHAGLPIVAKRYKAAADAAKAADRK